jgi:hypothetical protein
MTEFTVVANNLALPRGTRFTYRPRFPIETGATYLLTVGRRLTIVDYYQDIAGFDWIVQPGRMIKVTGEVNIEIWGLVELLDPSDDLGRTVQSGVLVASLAII